MASSPNQLALAHGDRALRRGRISDAFSAFVSARNLQREASSEVNIRIGLTLLCASEQQASSRTKAVTAFQARRAREAELCSLGHALEAFKRGADGRDAALACYGRDAALANFGAADCTFNKERAALTDSESRRLHKRAIKLYAKAHCQDAKVQARYDSFLPSHLGAGTSHADAHAKSVAENVAATHELYFWNDYCCSDQDGGNVEGRNRFSARRTPPNNARIGLFDEDGEEAERELEMFRNEHQQRMAREYTMRERRRARQLITQGLSQYAIRGAKN
jgi:hypothetical protein